MESAHVVSLGTERLSKLIPRLAFPSVIAQVVNVLYNIVDRMYIGHIPQAGALALTGVGVAFPVLMLVFAFTAFAGAGGAPLAAIMLGKGDKEKAEKILGNAVCMLLIFSVVLTVVVSLLKRPLLFFFGASEQTISYAEQYLGIYILGTVFVQLAFGLNQFINSQGFARTAMLSVVIGAGTNVVLDPIFIFGFGMGVAGAAIATIISQALSAFWVMHFLISEKSVIRIKGRMIRPDMHILLNILALGIAPFIMIATESAIQIVFNTTLLRYGGDMYVGSMTILTSLMQLLVIPINGFTHGVQPIISYNYGAKQFDRVKRTIKIMLAVTLIGSSIGCAISIFFPATLAKIFTTEKELVELVGNVMPIFMSGMAVFGIQMTCQTAFMGLGQAKISLFIALLRKVILLIPLILLLPRFFGVMGIYYAEPIADITSALTAGLIFLFTYKKILTESTLDKIG